MQRESLITAINISPVIRVSKRLAKMLRDTETPERFCANPACNTSLYNKDSRAKYCSRSCRSKITQNARSHARKGGIIAGRNRGGKNPNRHIRIRVNGKQVYLHRYIVESQMGVKLGEDEIVHHRDGNKHHNCFWKDVNDCPYEHIDDMPNLEILTGEARIEHIRRHQEEMQRARRR
jgi:hypothetical protein